MKLSILIALVLVIGVIAIYMLFKLFGGSGIDHEAKGPDGLPIIFWTITQEKHRDVLKLLDEGYDIEKSGHFGATPLLQAAFIDDWVMVYLLLERGANPLATDRRGYTLPYLASSSQVDLDGKYGRNLTKVQDELKALGMTTVYEPKEVKRMQEAGEWPPKDWRTQE